MTADDDAARLARNLRKFNLAGALRFNATEATIIPTPSGDGRIIVRMLVLTDDPDARHLAFTVEPEALVGLTTSCISIANATRTGEIHRIAAALDAAQQIDNIGDEPPSPA